MLQLFVFRCVTCYGYSYSAVIYAHDDLPPYADIFNAVCETPYCICYTFGVKYP